MRIIAWGLLSAAWAYMAHEFITALWQQLIVALSHAR